jgi:hypothetical protein
MPKKRTGTRVPDSLPVRVPGSEIPENPIPVDMPPRSQMNVPVKSVWTTLPSKVVDWLVKLQNTGQLCCWQGLFAVRRIAVLCARSKLRSIYLQRIHRRIAYNGGSNRTPGRTWCWQVRSRGKWMWTRTVSDRWTAQHPDCRGASWSYRIHQTTCGSIFQVSNRFGTESMASSSHQYGWQPAS